MNKQTICRKPLSGQDCFIIAAAYVKTINLRSSLENCREMYVNRLNAGNAGAEEAGRIAAACREVAMECVFENGTDAVHFPVLPAIDRTFSPEELRRAVFSAVLSGALGIEYAGILDDRTVWKNDPEPVFHFIKDLNYRLTQYGRTLMALKREGMYCSRKTAERYPAFAPGGDALSKSRILAGEELPEGLVIGEFADNENNRYLMVQNVNCEEKNARSFVIKLAREFRIYRVTPHNGKQILVKDRMTEQSILVMPGDGDLMRYQPAEEEPFLIEYTLKK